MPKWSVTKLNALLRRMERVPESHWAAAELRACQQKPVRVKAKRAQPRRGPMRDPKYRKWLRDSLCLVPSVMDGVPALAALVCCKGPIDPAHTERNGLSSKGADSSCVPLCRYHHEEQHKIGIPAFEKLYGLSMKAEAAKYFAQFQKEQGNG